MSKKLKLHLDATATMFEFAHKLREQSTKAEQILWQHVRRGHIFGLKFRRQHPSGVYILDFFCHNIRLAIELDGGYHEGAEQQQKDELRTKHLNEVDIHVMRFKNDQVIYHIDDVVRSIREKASELMGK